MPDEVTAKSDPPPSKSKHFIDRLNAYRNIILATAALATAIGSWLKPTDTSATKQSFDWTTQKVQELSKNDVQMHDDIVALRAYLEGMRATQPAPTPVPVVTESVGRLTGATRRPLRRPHQSDAMAVVDQALDDPLPSIGPFADAPELPALKADPHSMTRPSFEDVTLDQ